MTDDAIIDDSMEYYGDGAWYDAEYVHIRGDIPYYVEVARRTEGRVLELACGTGRLSIPMAEAGPSVVGVDCSGGMLKAAREKTGKLRGAVQERLTFVEADARNVRLGESFETVVLAFNTLMHMCSDDDLAAALKTAFVHVATRGLFFLDVHNAYPTASMRRDPSGRYDPQQMIDPKTQQRYIVSENNEFDPRAQINTMHFYYLPVDREGRPCGAEQRRTLRLRVMFPRELDRWLSSAGFSIVEDWDDFDRTKPFSARAGRRVMALRRRT